MRIITLLKFINLEQSCRDVILLTYFNDYCFSRSTHEPILMTAVFGEAQRDDLYQEQTKELMESVLTETGQGEKFLEKLNAVKKEFQKDT